MRANFEFGLSVVMLVFCWCIPFVLISSTVRMDKFQLDRYFYGPKPTWYHGLMAIGGFVGMIWILQSFAERHWAWLASSYAALIITVAHYLVQYIRARHNRRLQNEMKPNGS